MLWPLGLQSWSITYKQENSNEGRLPSGLHPLLLQQLMFQVGGTREARLSPHPGSLAPQRAVEITRQGRRAGWLSGLSH